MDKHKLDDLFAKIDSVEEIENIELLTEELWEVYHKFSELSNRVMRVFRRYMPSKNARIGLSSYILSLFDEHDELTREEIANLMGEFEYTVTPKNVTDSLYFLTKTKRIWPVVNVSTGKRSYRKGSG